MPWILGWFALGGNPQAIIRNLTNAEQQVIQVPVNTAIKAYLLVGVIAAGLGLTVWLTETEIAKKQGYEVKPPNVEPIRTGAPPSFGASSGVRAAAGPVSVGGGITSGGGSGDVGGMVGEPTATRRPSVKERIHETRREVDEEQRRAEQRRYAKQAAAARTSRGFARRRP